MGKIGSAKGGPSVASEGGAEKAERRNPLRLSVASFTKKVERSSEGSFEKKFYKALEACGFPNWHMAVRERGWPDRYAKGGHWFELKSLHSLSDDSQLSDGQQTKLAMLAHAGDKTYYVAKFEHTVIFLPYLEFKRDCHLSPAEAVALGHRYSYKTVEDLKEMIRYVVY